MINEIELREKLAAAGRMHDGHVTNGSLNEQMDIIRSIVEFKWWVRQADNLGGYPARCVHGRLLSEPCESCVPMLCNHCNYPLPHFRCFGEREP